MRYRSRGSEMRIAHHDGGPISRANPVRLLRRSHLFVVFADLEAAMISPEMRAEVLSSLKIATSDLEAIEEECPGYDLQPVIEQLHDIIRKLESSALNFVLRPSKGAERLPLFFWLAINDADDVRGCWIDDLLDQTRETL